MLIWLLFKVSKPYDEFFSQENLKLMEVEAMHDKPEAPPEDMDVEVPVDGPVVEADPVQPEENDWGDAGEEGGYDED